MLQSLFNTFITSIPLLAAIMFLLLLAKLALDLTTSYNLRAELLVKRNAAVGLGVLGYYLGFAFTLLGVLSGSKPQPFYLDLSDIMVYGTLGIVLLNISRLVNDKLIMFKFDNTKEMVQDQNLGTGAVEAGTYISSGLVVMGALHGDSSNLTSGLTSAIVFFLLAQMLLVIFGLAYEGLTTYDIHKEIAEDYEDGGKTYGGNTAAGIAFGGNLVALGLIIGTAAKPTFISWGENLPYFFLYALCGPILLLALRKLLGWAIIGVKGGLDKHIAAPHRNTCVAVMEAVLMVTTAIAITTLIH